MAESAILLTEGGGGKKSHTWQRAIGGVNVEDEFVLPGEFPYASYRVYSGIVSVATAADHILQIMAGSTLNLRIRRWRLKQHNFATAAALRELQLLRLTSAGTGGTVITPAKASTADAAASFTAMTLPTVKGTESTIVDGSPLLYQQAISTTVSGQTSETWEWQQQPGEEPLIIAAGVANGIAFKNIAATAAATVIITLWAVETAFV